jgi:hypothetical protein
VISDSLPVGPPCRRYASAEVDECRFRHVDVVMLAVVLSECIAALRRNSIESNACRLMPSSVNWPTSATIHRRGLRLRLQPVHIHTAQAAFHRRVLDTGSAADLMSCIS